METFSGSVERVTYYNDENGYSVLKIMPDKRMPEKSAKDGTVTVVGIMPELNPGETVEFAGNWIEDPRYGVQMKAETVVPIQPDSLEGITRYLASGIVRGIGPRTAEKIVKHFGLETITILNKTPQRIHEVPELKTNLADDLIQAWENNVAVRQTMIFLQQYGVSTKMATRIHSHYGAETINQVKEDPYALADEVFGIGFIKADQIAINMGMEMDAPQRLRAGLRYTLGQLSNDGHTFAPRGLLIDKACEILGTDNRTRLKEVLDDQIEAKALIAETLPNDDKTDAIYLPLYYDAETTATENLHMIANTPSDMMEDAAEINWAEFLGTLTGRNSVELSEQQQGAVKAALTSKVSVLTGGPGTGKTTTLRMVIEALSDLKYSFKLASPTGRAAKRLAEATGREASTIHRLLGYAPRDGFAFNEEYPLEVDMLVVDEASMIDLELFDNMLRALTDECHLLLVGDVDQLPSVGAGNVLNDVIASGVAHVTRLETIFRQQEGSHIVRNAHLINSGQQPMLDNQSEDFFFFREEDPAEAATLVVDVVMNRIPEKFGYNPMEDVQVIAPMYRGSAGVDALNSALQKALNGSKHLAEKRIGTRLFRKGDKVMQTRNNYEKDVFNGDIGRITGIDLQDGVFEINFDGRYQFYEFSNMEEIIHAYCISTHRSQGSEYPVVVMPLLTQHYMMLQRNLLYTAITRAKKLVVMVGNRNAVRIAVQNNKVSERHTALKTRLQAL